MATKKKSAAAKKKPAAAKKAAAPAKKKLTTKDRIKAANKVMMGHIAAGNATAAAGCYSKKAQLLPPGAPLVKGAKNIAGFWAGAIAQGVKPAVLKTQEVDDIAFPVFISYTGDDAAHASALKLFGIDISPIYAQPTRARTDSRHSPASVDYARGHRPATCVSSQ